MISPRTFSLCLVYEIILLRWKSHIFHKDAMISFRYRCHCAFEVSSWSSRSSLPHPHRHLNYMHTWYVRTSKTHCQCSQKAEPVYKHAQYKWKNRAEYTARAPSLTENPSPALPPRERTQVQNNSNTRRNGCVTGTAKTK